jgi:pimeloyl-ACP methyl ester carboxylesterase
MMTGKLAGELASVRARYTPRSLDVEGVPWTYLCGGRGDETLLLLPGGPGRGETSFQYIAAFEQQYRIIAPDYSSTVRTIDKLVEGLVAILDNEQVVQAHVVGGSYSGLVAQCLARRHGSRIGALILSDTGLPRPERVRRHQFYRAIVTLVPMPLLRTVLWLGTCAYVHEISAERAFWRAYFHGIVRSLTRADLLSRLDIWIDFDRHYVFGSDVEKPDSPVLIVEADRDPLFRPAERVALRRLYPRAETHLFLRGGHAASLARTDEYIAVFDAFLSRRHVHSCQSAQHDQED